MTSFALSQCLIGIAFCFDLASFQFRNRKHILLCFIASASLIATHFIFLDRLTAGLLIYVSVFRFTVSYFTTSAKLMVLCMVLAGIVVLSTYAGFISLLAFMGAVIGTWASFRPDDRTLRRAMMAGTSLWIVHNILVNSPAAVALETFFLGSNIFGYYRFYIRNNKE